MYHYHPFILTSTLNSSYYLVISLSADTESIVLLIILIVTSNDFYWISHGSIRIEVWNILFFNNLSLNLGANQSHTAFVKILPLVHRSAVPSL